MRCRLGRGPLISTVSSRAVASGQAASPCSMSCNVIVDRRPPPAAFGDTWPSLRFNHTHRLTDASPTPNSSASSGRSEEHTSELQSRLHLVCRLLLEKKKKNKTKTNTHNKTKHNYHT